MLLDTIIPSTEEGNNCRPDKIFVNSSKSYNFSLESTRGTESGLSFWAFDKTEIDSK